MLPSDTSTPEFQEKVRNYFRTQRLIRGLGNNDILNNWGGGTPPSTTHIAGWITGSKSPMSEKTIGRMAHAMGIVPVEFEKALSELEDSQEPININDIVTSVDRFFPLMSNGVLLGLQKLENTHKQVVDDLRRAQDVLNSDTIAANKFLKKARVTRESRVSELTDEMDSYKQMELLELRIEAQMKLSRGHFHETINSLSLAMQISLEINPSTTEELSVWRQKIICLNAMRYEYEKAAKYLNRNFVPPLTKSSYETAILITKSPDYPIATEHYNSFFEEPKVGAEAGFYGAYINKVETFKQATRVFEQLKADPAAELNVAAYGAYLNKAETFEQATRVFEQLRADPTTEPNVAVYGAYINKAETFAEGYSMLVEAFNSEQKQNLNLKIFDLTLRLARKPKETASVQKLLRKSGLQPDMVFYTNLVENSSGVEMAMLHYSHALKSKLPFDSHFVLAMMKHHWDNSDNARAVMKYFDKRFGVDPNKFHFAYLLGITRDGIKAQKTYNEMISIGIIPDERIVAIMASKVITNEN